MSALAARAVPFALLLACSFSGPPAPAAVDAGEPDVPEVPDAPPEPNAFRRVVGVAAPSTSGAVADVPIAIELSGDSGLSTNASADGSDLLFTLADGTVLPVEIARYDRGAGDLVAWVRLPSLPVAGTEIHFYYGDGQQAPPRTDPWVGLADLVWHFDELDGSTTPPSTSDSSPSGLDAPLEDDSSITVVDTAVVGSAYDYNGDVIFAGTAADLDRGTQSFAVSLWFDQQDTLGTEDLVWFKGGGGQFDPGYAMLLGSDNWRVRISDNDGDTATIVFGTEAELGGAGFVHLVMVVDRDTDQLRAYTNGVARAPVDITTIGSINSADRPRVGGQNQPPDGIVDEVHAYGRAISDDFVRVLHANGPGAPSLVAVGGEERAFYPE